MPAITAQSLSTRLPRYSRLDSCLPIKIGRPKRLILEAIGVFHYLSATQLTRLIFSCGSLTYVRQHLKELFHAGYLRRIFLPKITPHGSSVAIYTLDKKGLSYLKSIGKPPEGRFRASEQARREELYLEHTLASNDFVILADRFCRQHPQVQIAQVKTERSLKRDPVIVHDGKNIVRVIPDSWLKLHVNTAYQLCLALELDRGTVERKRFQRKIQALVQYAKGPYQKAFGTESLTILFVTTAGEKRLRDILTWTQSVLTSMGAGAYADLFRFAAFDTAGADPDQVFLSPRWLKPFEETPLPLIRILP